MNDPTAPSPRWFALSLLALGCLGFAAAWVLLAYVNNRQNSWMAVLGALDAVLLLRLARVPAGWTRAILATTATAMVIVLANWAIAATQIGRMLGLLPWQSLTKLGLSYGWTLAQLANGPSDIIWLGGALLFALLAAR